MKKFISIIFGVLSLFLLKEKVFGYDLTLTAVGTQSTLGTNYSVVNYYGGVPTLVGTASPSAQVGVKINTLLSYASASTSGVWQFVPNTLNQGENTVVITSGTQSISFLLNFNATASATPSALPDESTLLDAGVWQYYVPLIATGLGVYLLGVFGKKRMQKWEKGD